MLLPTRVKTLAGILLVSLGAAFSLQGSLVDFLPYYNKIFNSGVCPGLGDYNFALRYSPLVGGWRELFSPLKCDTFWFGNLFGAKGFSLVVLLILAISLGALMVFWWNFFKKVVGNREICVRSSKKANS